MPPKNSRSNLLKPWSIVSPSPEMKVELIVGRDVLHFQFELRGDLTEVRLPSLKLKTERKRFDELWRTTCFELFVGAKNQESYIEMNVSPNGDWNVYAFDSYRTGMRVLEDAAVELEQSGIREGGFFLSGRLQHSLFSEPALEASATAVIEYKNVQTQYWAVNHAGEKPDFHLRSSFVISLL